MELYQLASIIYGVMCVMIAFTFFYMWKKAHTSFLLLMGIGFIFLSVFELSVEFIDISYLYYNVIAALRPVGLLFIGWGAYKWGI